MSHLTNSRATALCLLASLSVGLGRASAQAPPYPTQPPPPAAQAPAYGPGNMPPGYAPLPSSAPTPYSQPATAARPAPDARNSGRPYPDTRAATRPAAYTAPLGADPSAAAFNADSGNAGVLPNANAEFGSDFLPMSDGDFSSAGHEFQFAGHETKSSKGCTCDSLGRYGGPCASCSDKACLFPECRGGLQFGGWLQQGLTMNFGNPGDRMNTPVLFNDRSNDYQLNQLYLYAQRQVRNDGYQWDWGGRVDVLLGTDARFLTVPGLEEHHDGTPKWNGETKQYGFAIPQAYIELAAPWLHGVSMKAGHFYSIAGYETAAAPQNFFYSHAYTYLYGEPFTHTGALFTARPNEIVTVNAGYTKGWDVLESNSNEYGILASIKFTSLDRRTSLAATVHSGQDVTGVRVGGALIDEDRHFYSIVLQHQINDCLRYVFQHDFGYQEDGEVVVNTGPRTITFDEAKWYGINQYLIYEFDHTTSAALRVEWFRDQDHSRLAVPVKFNPGGTTFLGGNYVAVTGGVNWRPNGNITIRPEVRWDYSDLKGNGGAPGGDPNVRAFDDARHSSQVTAAVDVIVAF